jgi:hypothetical protein
MAAKSEECERAATEGEGEAPSRMSPSMPPSCGVVVPPEPRRAALVAEPSSRCAPHHTATRRGGEGGTVGETVRETQ